MNEMITFKRNSTENESIIKCYIFPSLIVPENDNYVWSNSDYKLMYENMLESEKSREFIIRKNENVIGYCVLKHIDFENQNAMVSSRVFLIDGKEPGKDYIIELMNALNDFIFKQVDLIKIYGIVDEDNPYISFLEETGFVKEGCLCCNVFKHGKYIDQLIYSKFTNKD
ncbi:MAG: GNAT family N-acetyltransferase [Spirochaetales bacterium]|nr:GNAT family N-acetyltransferase [Spirochaetales bacterium]